MKKQGRVSNSWAYSVVYSKQLLIRKDDTSPWTRQGHNILTNRNHNSLIDKRNNVHVIIWIMDTQNKNYWECWHNIAIKFTLRNYFRKIVKLIVEEKKNRYIE